MIRKGIWKLTCAPKIIKEMIIKKNIPQVQIFEILLIIGLLHPPTFHPLNRLFGK